jgi:hypothetical protein
MLVYFVSIWNILCPFGIPISWSFGNFMAIWYAFQRFGLLDQEKSGNPALRRKLAKARNCQIFAKETLHNRVESRIVLCTK